jgi:hypothetical protein
VTVSVPATPVIAQCCYSITKKFLGFGGSKEMLRAVAYIRHAARSQHRQEEN